MENLTQKFLRELSNTRDPVHLLAVCTILKVDIYTDEKDEEEHPIPKEFGNLLTELMKSYDCAGRKRKRELLKILRDANKATGGGVDGLGTENTETPIQDEKVQ